MVDAVTFGEKMKAMEGLRKLLASLGVVSARRKGNMSISINGQKVAVFEANFSISHNVDPINVLGKLDVEEL